MQITRLVLSPTLTDLCNDITDNNVSNFLLKKKPVLAKFNYLDVTTEDNKPFLTFLPNSRKLSEDDPDFWTSKQRQKSRPGALLEKILSLETSKDLDKWINALKINLLPPESTINIVKGDEIKDAYLESNYLATKGNSQLEKSCMRYEHTIPYLEIYSKNPEVINCAVVEVEGKVAARALVWEAKVGKESIKVLDRIYHYQQVFADQLLQWGAENVDYIRENPSKMFVSVKDGKLSNLDAHVDLKNIDLDRYPYLDTFKYLKGKTLYNLWDAHHTVLHLINTEGKFKTLWSYDMPKTTGFTKTNTVWIEDVGWHLKKDCVLIQETWVHSKHAANCAECGITSFKKDFIHIGTNYFCKRHDTFGDKKICRSHILIYEGECPRCKPLEKCLICTDPLFDSYEVDEGKVCSECVSRFYVKCHFCKTRHKTIDSRVDKEFNISVCPPCVEKEYKKCCRCTFQGIKHHFTKNEKNDHICQKCLKKEPKCTKCKSNGFYYKLTEGICEVCTAKLDDPNAVFEPTPYACACSCQCRNSVDTANTFCTYCNG